LGRVLERCVDALERFGEQFAFVSVWPAGRAVMYVPKRDHAVGLVDCMAEVALSLRQVGASLNILRR
jgi:hypothetical protein